MKLSLQAIKVLLSMSEETYCYSGNLYLDNKKVAEVGNHGHGGADNVRWLDPSAEAKINAYLQTLPLVPLGTGNEVPMDLELWCAERITEHLNAQDLKRLVAKAKKSIFGVTSETKPEGYITWPLPYTVESLGKVETHLRKKGLRFYLISPDFIAANPADWLEKAHKAVKEG
jgi:hypothetical protein